MGIFIGVDIEKIIRFKNLDKKVLNKIFTNQEIKYCMSKKNNAQHFAVRFAGKEAIIKAFSSFKKKIELKEIEILNDEKNVPIVKLKNAKKYDIKISLSHNQEDAIAFVLVSK